MPISTSYVLCKDFDGTGQYPHLDDAEIFTIVIKDYASHLASACVVLTWMPD